MMAVTAWVTVRDETPNRQADPGALALINQLRFVALACRVKPRTDLFEACALLHVNRCAAQEAHAEALMRCLNQALGKTARLHAPGTEELSFDEAWLIALARACARRDDNSTAFLLKSQVCLEHRRLVRFLMGRISDCFPLI